MQSARSGERREGLRLRAEQLQVLLVGLSDQQRPYLFRSAVLQ